MILTRIIPGFSRPLKICEIYNPHGLKMETNQLIKFQTCTIVPFKPEHKNCESCLIVVLQIFRLIIHVENKFGKKYIQHYTNVL